MYKPRTVEQFKVMEFIKENFHTDSLLIAPASRSGIVIEDGAGERMAFQWMDGSVTEAPLPVPASRDEQIAFVKAFRDDPNHPQLRNLDELTDWWLNNPTPLSYQQVLNLPDALYRRYLTCDRMLELEDVLTLVMRGSVTKTEYLDLRLWYADGHSVGNWLG